jgi:UPF0755 protein
VRRAAFFLLLLLVAAASIAGWTAYRRLTTPYKGYAGEEAFVEIPAGSGPAAIGRALVNQGVVIDALTFRVALWRSGVATKLKAGDYRFDLPMTPDAVLAKIVAGEVYLRTVTFPEGLTVRQMARIFEEHGFGAARDFIDAASDRERIRALDPSARDLEGYLFPETYSLRRRTTAGELIGLMVGRFEAVFDDRLRSEAQGAGLTVGEAVTLASIIEKETSRPDERPLVSAVYHNRLERKMGLQCDPTVIYALERAGRYAGNLTRENMRIDSPYNTYRYAGLPPGPISAPGRASLEAAVRPARVDYLYFVSRNDGSHAFASTLDEHNRNVHRFQVAPFGAQRNSRAPLGAGRAPGGSRR